MIQMGCRPSRRILQKAAAYPKAWACITDSNGNGAMGGSWHHRVHPWQRE